VKNRELKACGKHGHVTYAPTETDLATRLRTQTALGEAWRCLRCGTWVLGEPAASGPADQAPVPPRGKALRQLTILRVLAVERAIRAVVLIAAGYGVYRFESAQKALQGSFGRLVPALRPLASQFGVDLDHSSLVSGATKALHARAGTLNLVVIGLVVYGLLELVEGVGLWLAKRWGEYFTVIATAAFLPYEVSELFKSVTVTKVGAFVINVVAVVYLLLAKRLFGLRGGAKAYEDELRGESLFEVEAAGHERSIGDDDGGRSEGMSAASAGTAESPAR
jgi:uncharacterized membrane protein (DUF2068 family)